MFEEIKKEIRETIDYQDNLKELLERRLRDGLSNEWPRFLEILKDDPSASDLLRKTNKLMAEESNRGKISLEKKEGVEDSVTVHLYDHMNQDLLEQAIRPISSIQTTQEDGSVKVSQDTFNQLYNLAVDYDYERQKVEQELPTNTI